MPKPVSRFDKETGRFRERIYWDQVVKVPNDRFYRRVIRKRDLIECDESEMDGLPIPHERSAPAPKKKASKSKPKPPENYAE